MNKELTASQTRVLTVLARMSKAVETDPDEAELYEEALEPILCALSAQEAFGTEGQCDPRGDFRNGLWSMTRVEGCEVAPLTTQTPEIKDDFMTTIDKGLLFAEEVLHRIRESVRNTAVWEDSAVVSNEMLEAGTSFETMVLQDPEQSLPDYSLFLSKHWARARGSQTDATAFFVAREASPRWLTIRTESRQGYLAALPNLAKALDGLHVSLEETTSWSWDHATLTKAGRPTHRSVYVLTVCLQKGQKFSASRWLAKAASNIPRGGDTRADRCVWQMLEDIALPRTLVESSSPEPSGLRLTCPDEKAADKVAQQLFQDCLVVKTKNGRATELLITYA